MAYGIFIFIYFSRHVDHLQRLLRGAGAKSVDQHKPVLLLPPLFNVSSAAVIPIPIPIEEEEEIQSKSFLECRHCLSLLFSVYYYR